MTLRLGLVGGGWISRLHLEALQRLGRTELIGVVAGSRATADEVTAEWGGTSYDDLDRMLEAGRPDVVYVAVPPHRAVAIGERLVAQADPVPDREAARRDRWRGRRPPRRRDRAEPARRRRRLSPAGARHPGRGPGATRRTSRAAVRGPLAGFDARPGLVGPDLEGGGQVVEQATHLYDLARTLVGEATVVGAASTRDLANATPGVDVADSTAAVLRFGTGAVGSFANTRKISTAVIEIEIVSDGLLTRLSKRPDRGQGDWHVTFDDGTVIRAISAECDPYEKQAASFLDAVEWADPGGVLCTYEDALGTDRLTRAVVAATGAPG